MCAAVQIVGMRPKSNEYLVRSWSTDGIAPAHRLDFYASTISSTLDPMSISRSVAGPFNFKLDAADLGAISVVQARGRPHSLQRGPTELARSDGEYFRLIVNRASNWNLAQRGAIRVRAGQVVMLDSRYGHKTELPADFDCLHVRIPASWMRTWVSRPEAMTGGLVSASPRWGNALATFVAALSPELALRPPLPPALLVDQLGALLALAAGDVGASAPVASAAEMGWAGRVCDALTQRCCETALTASDVANDLGISVRTLHRCLAARGTTFGELLISARVAVARRMLSSRLSGRLSIAEVGYRSGFMNASHFARTLRLRAGVTPKQLRRGYTA